MSGDYMFGKKEKKIVLVTVDTSHCETDEEQRAYLDKARETVKKGLKDIGREDDFDVVVTPSHIQLQVAM